MKHITMEIIISDLLDEMRHCQIMRNNCYHGLYEENIYIISNTLFRYVALTAV